GNVKGSQAEGGVLTYLRPAAEFDLGPPSNGASKPAGRTSYFGEIGCLAEWPEAASAIPPEHRDSRRTATCAALDHVELVRIDRDCFRGLLSAIPALKAEVLKSAARRLAAAPGRTVTRSISEGRSPGPAPVASAPKTDAPLRREFVEQGLYNAQRLLVLDLEACTRCDECTK